MYKMNKSQWALVIVGIASTLIYSNLFGKAKQDSKLIDYAPYVIGAIVLVGIFGLVMPTKHCPNCKTKLPKIRLPRNSNEFLFGGTTCPNCKAEIDNHGNVVRR